ncbi:MAG: hypothetical protein KAJ36_05355, partial [Candidatus Thorarchaeota archaeon]|nr:hypothetical protein [Candidatus Thorarchaeota archaeon]
MRSIFRRKQSDDTSEEISTKRSLPRLGIFSPATESHEVDPVRELKRLSELEEIFVRSKKLESLADVPYVVEEIKDGNIVL